MIIKMKKVTLFMSDSAVDADKELNLLGKLGVMHVSPFQPPKDESIERVTARIKQLEKAIEVLEHYAPETEISKPEGDTDYSSVERGDITLLENVIKASENLADAEKSSKKYADILQWYKNWGDISIAGLNELADHGAFIKLYLIDDRDLKSVRTREDIKVVGKIGHLNQVVLVTSDIKEELTSQTVEVPSVSAKEAKKLFDDAQKLAKESELGLNMMYSWKYVLEEALEERKQRYNLRNVRYGGFSIDERVRCLKGYIPVDRIDDLEKAADKNNWGYIIEDPTEEETDEVPTLIRSSKWASRINPVMNFMGLVPGYKELDVSRVFMLFFTFFTGILVGDAGYGLVFLLITILVHAKMKFKGSVEFSLMYTLSVSILFWGVLTGTYFGSEEIANWHVLSRLKIDKLASFGGDDVFIQKFMFLVGAIHLTVGHLQSAWKVRNSVMAIGQLGWVAIVWGLFLIVNQMVLGIDAPKFMVWLFIGGALLIGLFSNPGTSFFKGVLSSLGNLPLSIISGFSDIISYIRLYAVGLSTVLMAMSFNQMAIGDGITTVLSGIMAVLVLILGHTLNMILAGMAVIVHGVRLNMLEYAGHAGVEFSGSEYNPFKMKDNKAGKE